MIDKPKQQRHESAERLRAESSLRREQNKIVHSDGFADSERALADIPGALAYLDSIEDALRTGLAIPRLFRDHQLRGNLARFRSVIIGELEGSDVTFILLYRRRRKLIQLLWIDQHDNVYRA